jgi:predicted TIM-barrel fold metal-dependent hydrolase
MISLATKYENVYIDTSAYTPERYPEALVRFMKGAGRHKVLFGSNFPMIQPAKCLAQLGMLDLSDEERRLFLSENAKKVFRLES